MLKIKGDELFGPHMQLRAFPDGHARHAKFVNRTPKELVISIGLNNKYYGDPKSRWWIDNIEPGAFEIKLSESAQEEVEFDYLVQRAAQLEAINARPEQNETVIDSVFTGEARLIEANEHIVEFLPGETLNDLLALVGRPQMPDTLKSGRIIIRHPGSKSIQYVPLTPQMLDDELEHGTVYEFPVHKRWVYVTGSVFRPGRYLYQPGWTVQEYLGRAGGPDRSGSRRTCYLTRLDGTRTKCKPTDKVLPGDMIHVPEKFYFDRLLPVIAGVSSTLIYVLLR